MLSASRGPIPTPQPYRVEYWDGKNALDFDDGPEGTWKVFQAGAQQHAKGGTVVLKLSDAPVSTRYVRIWMNESSNTCDLHGSDDPRNCVGYAIEQLAAGSIDANGAFTGPAADLSAKEKPLTPALRSIRGTRLAMRMQAAEGSIADSIYSSPAD